MFLSDIMGYSYGKTLSRADKSNPILKRQIPLSLKIISTLEDCFVSNSVKCKRLSSPWARATIWLGC